MKPHIVDFLKYIENKDNRKVPFTAKLLYPDKFGLTKEDLNVKGDLNLHRSKIKSLPDNLTIQGNLDLSATDIESFPDNLTVEGNLDITFAKIKSLPNNLKIGEDLYIYSTPLAKRMSTEEIKQEIKEKGGYLKGRIITS